jgi:hypothetical protein
LCICWRLTWKLRRINMSGFFNPTEIPDGSRDVKCTATDPANSMATMKLTRLPQPEITFKPPLYDFGSRENALDALHPQQQESYRGRGAEGQRTPLRCGLAHRRSHLPPEPPRGPGSLPHCWRQPLCHVRSRKTL